MLECGMYAYPKSIMEWIDFSIILVMWLIAGLLLLDKIVRVIIRHLRKNEPIPNYEEGDV